mmetsp:Transcript_30103/g.51236  ORF Transcript_30103/g.51236 Transcript_30103/m.51236 type:complete len:366 (-) Transcript_30103:66-1163(-)
MQSKEEFPTLLSFNDDVLVGITSYLKPNEMASAAKSCKRFQLLTERTVYQLYQDATPYEKTALPKYHDESWVELYHHLLMLRSPLIFSQLIGSNIRYLNGKSHVGVNSWMEPGSCAICSEQVMRAGKHYAIFKKGNDDRSRGPDYDIHSYAGIIRPIKGLDSKDIQHFDSITGVGTLKGGREIDYREALLQERTERWGAVLRNENDGNAEEEAKADDKSEDDNANDPSIYQKEEDDEEEDEDDDDESAGDINCVDIDIANGIFESTTWDGNKNEPSNYPHEEDAESHYIQSFRGDRNIEIGLLLDLDCNDGGTLSVYQNGCFVGIIADGLVGEFCWHASLCPSSQCVNTDYPDASIERGTLEALM